MKKILLSVLSVMLFVGASQAQNYKPFKLGLGIGYAKPSGGGGILIDFEPAYRINDDIAVGLRFESAAMVKALEGASGGSVSANGSYTLNGQYYLSDATVRPYVGAGLGLFALASVSVDANSAAAGGGTSFGFYPRLGVDIGHFNLNLDYNLVGASKAVTVDSNGNIGEGKIKNSYLGFRIGAFIFGGRK